jgi:hypothetical protein
MKANLKLDTGRHNYGQGGIDAFEADVEGLLGEDVLAGCGGGVDEVTVGGRWGGDHHGINGAVSQRPLGIGVCSVDPVLSC